MSQQILQDLYIENLLPLRSPLHNFWSHTLVQEKKMLSLFRYASDYLRKWENSAITKSTIKGETESDREMGVVSPLPLPRKYTLLSRSSAKNSIQRVTACLFSCKQQSSQTSDPSRFADPQPSPLNPIPVDQTPRPCHPVAFPSSEKKIVAGVTQGA